jgi:hypothetical protein
MGFNTACIVLNDFLHEIEKDPQFGRKVADAVRANGNERHMRHYTPGFSVLQSQHADYVQVVAISGNTIRWLGSGGNYRSTDEEVLRRLADGMGFDIVPKKGRKLQPRDG